MTRSLRRVRQKPLFFRSRAGLDKHGPYDFAALLSTVLRYRVGLLAWVLACVTLAGTYVVLTPAEYTAYTQIVLETPKRPRLVLDADGDTVPMDSAQADSRIQVIKSERLLRFVFDTLQLADKAKVEKSPSFGFGRGRPLDDNDTSAFLDFMDRVSARRIGLSYVLELSYRAKSPSDAAHMVNSITSAYIRDLVMSAPSDSEVMQRRIFSVSHDAELLLAAVKAGTIPKTPVVGIDARVIGSAIEPLRKSSPHTLLTVAFALLVSLSTGAAFVLFMHNRDRKFRSRSQAKRSFGPDLLGVVTPAKGIGAVAAKDVANIIHRLSANGETPHVGIVSWQNAVATSAVVQSLATTPTGSMGVSSIAPSSGAQVEHFAAKSPVFIDLAPLDTSAALAEYGRVLNGVVLVVEQDATTHDDVELALDLLDATSVDVLGFVFYVPPPRASRIRRLSDRMKASASSLRQKMRRTIDLPRLKLHARRPVDLTQMKLRD